MKIRFAPFHRGHRKGSSALPMQGYGAGSVSQRLTGEPAHYAVAACGRTCSVLFSAWSPRSLPLLRLPASKNLRFAGTAAGGAQLRFLRQLLSAGNRSSGPRRNRWLRPPNPLWVEDDSHFSIYFFFTGSRGNHFPWREVWRAKPSGISPPLISPVSYLSSSAEQSAMRLAMERCCGQCSSQARQAMQADARPLPVVRSQS